MMKIRSVKAMVAAGLGALQGAFALGIAWLLKTVVDIILGDNTQLTFTAFCIIGIVYYGLYMLMYFYSRKSFLSALLDIRMRIKKRLFSGFLWEAEESHQKRKAGEVLAKFQHQLDMLETDYYEPMFSLVQNSATIIVAMGAIILLQWNAALLSLGLLLLYFLLTHNIKKKLEVLKGEKVQANTTENNELLTMIKAYHTAKDCKQEPYFLRRYGQRVETYENAACKVNVQYTVLAMIGGNLQSIITLLILLFGSILLAQGSLDITIGGILGLIELVVSLVGPIGNIGTITGQMKSTKAIRQGFAKDAEAGTRGKAEWQRNGDLPKLKKISLQNVSFSYDDLKVLDRVSMEILAGGKYAIVGKSGSGKTTLLKLLLKQLNPAQGSIQWNDVPYEDIQKADLYPKIGYVAQHPMIFHSSIRENIVVGGRGKRYGPAESRGE